MCKRERRSANVTLLIIFVLVFTGATLALENIPYVLGSMNRGSSEMEDTGDPEMMFAILARLGQSIIRSNNFDNHSTKRGLDLGLSRGYSGSQQAKHMMGIAAAGLSAGPGRRRRSQNTYRHRIPY